MVMEMMFEQVVIEFIQDCIGVTSNNLKSLLKTSFSCKTKELQKVHIASMCFLLKRQQVGLNCNM